MNTLEAELLAVEKLATELLSLIRATGERGLSQTDIVDYFNRHVRAVRISAALAELLDGATVRFEKVQTKGRPATRWFARPSPHASGGVGA